MMNHLLHSVARRAMVCCIALPLIATFSGCRSSKNKSVSAQPPVEMTRPIRTEPVETVTSRQVTRPRPATLSTTSGNDAIFAGVSDEELAQFYKPVKASAPVKPAVTKAPAKPERIVVGAGWDVRLKRTWKYVVLHHSATATGSSASFHRTHKRRGWDGLGYHFVIGNGSGSGDGEVEVGYRWTRQMRGAHAGNNDYNQHGIGICLVGNFDRGRPSPKQMGSLYALVRFLQKKASIPTWRVVGHKHVPNKDTHCPGAHFDVKGFQARLKSGAPSSWNQPMVVHHSSGASSSVVSGAGFP